MKIFAISGGLIGIPTIQELIKARLLTGIGVPDQNSQHIEQLESMGKAANIPVVILKKKSLKKELDHILHKQKPDVVFVLTFPYKIPAQVLKTPKFGFLNFHCAQLPNYRGPQPNFWELKNQEKHSAVTVHIMDANFDTGPIVYEEKVPIESHFTFGMLKVKLAYMAIKATQMVLMQLQMGLLNKKPQPKENASYFPKPELKDLAINWESQTATQILALIKASNPDYQGAVTSCRGIWVRVLAASPIESENDHQERPGTILTLDESAGLCVSCKDGQMLKLEILSLEEGMLLGHQLTQIGFAQGDTFQTISAS